MGDASVFARLYAYDRRNNAYEMIRHEANRDRFASLQRASPGRDSRDPTPFTTAGSDGEEIVEDYDNKQWIELSLDRDELLPRDSTEGWQFGSSRRVSDVLISRPGMLNVSRRHFSIKITTDFRVQLCQLSAQTTDVTYVKHGFKDQHIYPKKGSRIYVAMSPYEPCYWDSIRIDFGRAAGSVVFSVIFPNHSEDCGLEYMENLRRFVRMQASSVPGIGPLQLESDLSTAIGSRQSTLPDHFGILCYKQKLGEGGFGIVELLVDLETSLVAARKRFLKLDQTAKRKLPADRWEKEIKNVWNEVMLLSRNPHPHITPIWAYQEDPVPSIIMPYYPLGNIESVQGLTEADYISVFRQLLVVIDYLHGRGVAHRDLKPANILVESLNPISIVVSDFGLSKAVNLESNLPMTTFCGTKDFIAPEVLPVPDPREPRQLGYWLSVDIWSAGVIMLGWTFGLPSTMGLDTGLATVWVPFWSRALASDVRRPDRDGHPVAEVLRKMVVREPENRYTALECLDLGCHYSLFRRTRAGEYIDADDIDTTEDGARTPTQEMFQPKAPCPTPSHPLGQSVNASEIEERDEADADSLEKSAQWHKFLNYDAMPDFIDDSDSESQSFASAVAEMPPGSKGQQEQSSKGDPEEHLEAAQDATEQAPNPKAGQKHKMGKSNSSGKSRASGKSSKSSNSGQSPARKKARDGDYHPGYDAAVFSDVMGPTPDLRRELHGPESGKAPASSVSVIDWEEETRGTSMELSMVEGASNLSVQMA